MEPPGAIPPDRDKLSIVHQQPNINTPPTQHNSSLIGVSATGQQGLERLSRPLAFDKMEYVVREMQDPESGVPVRQQKMFLTSIPYAFMGYDLIEWLMDRLSIEESEALSIANQLCLHGYFFPVNDTKTLVVKDDSSLYRFQTPYYWPWQHKAPDNVEYAIYLAKRSLRNKQRHGLEDYESDALASLHKNLKGKWDFISMQAEEQVRLAKERKKGDKIVGDSQERAYWRVHRPPPGLFTPLEPCPVPSRDRQGIKPKKRTADDWQREVDYLKKSLGRTRMKMSQACESLVNYSETFSDYDFFLQLVLPSNPWVSEDITFWQLNNAIVDIPTEKRVKRWAISIEELVSDPTGLQEFTIFLEKEYSHENIRFWIAVNKLRRSAHSQVAKKVNEIYEEFLKPGAPCEINIDGKTMEVVQKGLKNPSRFTFDAAAEHIYMLLLKKDCYPRFIRSEHYKSLLASGIQPAHKKRFFGFGGVAKKKTSSVVPPNPALLTQSSGTAGVPPPGNLARRRGSDRSLTGSAHELAIVGVKDVSSKVPHSHSQSNLSEIPYREGSKSLSERLESTAETGACAVCPWDVPELPAESSSVLLSVCPWEENEDSNDSNKQRHTSTSSEISEVSERMRRSCGLRQNTLDSDFMSTKRLVPNITEQRRASMTMAPRVSDFQFAIQRQSVTRAATTPSPTALTYSAESFCSLTKASSFEARDEANLLKSLTISEECSELNESNRDIPITIDDKSIDESKTINSNNENTVNNIKTESVTLNLYSESSCDKSSSIASQGTTPTITVVCPTGELEEDTPALIEKESAQATATSATVSFSPQKSESDKSITSSSYKRKDSVKSPETVQEKEPVEKSKNKEKKVSPSSSPPLPLIPTAVQKSSVNIFPDTRVEIVDNPADAEEEEPMPTEELSPTTEEYQECAQFGDQADDYEYDIEAVETNLAPGCVAPAPTPAPSLAPLAEIEADPVEDEGDTETMEGTEQKQQEACETRKRRKKRDSTDSRKTDEKTGESSTQAKSDDTNRNAVCPWEDEDVATSTDATFVKTYATLGYL